MPDLFCCICRRFTTAKPKPFISKYVRKCHCAYFGWKKLATMTSHRPHIQCVSLVWKICNSGLVEIIRACHSKFPWYGGNQQTILIYPGFLYRHQTSVWIPLPPSHQCGYLYHHHTIVVTRATTTPVWLPVPTTPVWLPVLPPHQCVAWDSWDRYQHYVKKDWLRREQVIVGSSNNKSHPLVEVNKVLLPSFPIKLGLTKNRVKGLEKKGQGSQYPGLKFPQISRETAKDILFIDPQIQLYSDRSLEERPTSCDKDVWLACRAVLRNFLGNEESDNYLETQTHYQRVQHEPEGTFLHSHLDVFTANLDVAREAQADRFRQDTIFLKCWKATKAARMSKWWHLLL